MVHPTAKWAGALRTSALALWAGGPGTPREVVGTSTLSWRLQHPPNSPTPRLLFTPGSVQVTEATEHQLWDVGGGGGEGLKLTDRA